MAETVEQARSTMRSRTPLPSFWHSWGCWPRWRGWKRFGIKLHDAELVAAGSPVLQNGTGTVRLEDGRLGRLGAPVPVPEPGALCS